MDPALLHAGMPPGVKQTLGSQSAVRAHVSKRTSQSGKRSKRTDTGPIRTGQDTLREGAVEDGSTHGGERTRDSHKGLNSLNSH